MSPLVWFLAGGVSALFIARVVLRWMRRVFWLVVVAAFGVWSVFVVGPALGWGQPSKTQLEPSLAVLRGLLDVARGWFWSP